MKNRSGRKMFAICTTIASLITQMVFNPFLIIDSKAASSHSLSDNLIFENTEISSRESLIDNGDGTYTFKMEFGAENSKSDVSEDFATIRENYFVAPYNGKYLLDLWGGDGADGESTSSGEGGRGGNGAHLYGTVNLKKGDVIYYTLGGHGQPTTVTDEGGGANGEGGGLGNIVTSSYQVGGGGGYSAIFLFTSTDTASGYDVFAEKYLDENGNLAGNGILEADRTTRYIMIAGGGGGGGAGDGFVISGLFGGSSQVGRADGGDAGGFESAYGTIEGTGIVSGTYYAGSDGKSSGTSTAYIGHGGSNVPGQLADSITTLIKGAQPNDWFVTYNDSIDGGGGGSGDMRGGAGGAGFSGGSGGVMTAIVEANNVGGGGGGSSFVADSITKITDEEKSQYENAGYMNTANNSQSDGGGQVKITFLQADDANDVVERVNLKIPSLSKYFTVLDNVSVVDATGTALTCIEENGFYNINNAGIVATEAGRKLAIEIRFKPVTGFAGGNDVQIFNQDTPVIAVTQVLENGTGESVQYELKDELSYVNVPLDFKAIGKSYMTNIENPVYELEKLYEDQYTDIRNNLSANVNYDYIEQIGNYSVTDENGTVLTQPVQPTQTTRYTVSFTVTPKAGSKAVVGDVVEETVYSAVSKITILEEGEASLNGTDIKYTKTLEYDEDEDQYVLSLNVKAGKEALAANLPETVDVKKSDGDPALIYEIKKSGYYLIQAWGGTGGAGGRSTVVASWGWADGGAGGAGGYIFGYQYFEEGQYIQIAELALNGTKGDDGGFLGSGKGGTGGGYTSVYYVDPEQNTEIPLLVAGGGAGGNGGDTSSGTAGNSVNNTAQPDTTLASDISSYKGSSGGTGNGSASSAGTNFRSTTLSTDGTGLTTEAQLSLSKALGDYNNTDEEGGAVRITCLQLDESADSLKTAQASALTNYNLTATISDYFTIQDEITVTGVVEENGFVSAVNGQNISITAIKPNISVSEPDTDDGKIISSSIDFTINIPLKPVEKLVGGYAIPLLSSMALGQILDSENPDPVEITEKSETDNANVDIQYVFDANDLITSDVTIKKDEVSLAELKELLYSSDLTDGDWIWDGFAVSKVTVSPELTELPDETTTYQITVDVEPVKDNADKAAVKTSVTSVSKTLTATVFVNYSVETASGSHLTVSNDTAKADVDYITTLKADTGYKLPTTISVKTKSSQTEIDNFTYNPKTGEIKIAADTIAAYKDNLIIDAVAESNTFKLYTAYMDLDGKTIMNGPLYFEAGTEVAPSEFGELFDVPAYDETKYTFSWDNEEVQDAVDNDGRFTMPGSDLYVIGVFRPVEYDLTVQYVDENGTALLSPVTTKYGYNTTYSASAQEISGYALEEVKVDDETVETSVLVEGTMPVGGTTVTFIYKALQGNIKVSYIKKYPDTLTPPDDFENLIDEVEVQITANQPYGITSPAVPGYTAEKTEISGVADANASGMQYFVYYIPNQYKLNFDPQGGSLAVNAARKLVQYDLPYSFDATEGDYNHPSVGSGLPTPQKAGYEFAGWYTEPDGQGTKIENDSLVDIDGTPGQEVQVYAYWEAQTFTITVRFMDEDGQEMAENFSFEMAYGDSYDVEAYMDQNNIQKPDLGDVCKEMRFSDNAKGNMPAMNVDVTLTYYYKSYELVVNYKLQNISGYVYDWFSESQEIRYNKTYRVEKTFETAMSEYSSQWPEGAGGSDGYEAQQFTYVGTMPAEDLIINYYYVTDTPIISVDIEWGDLTYDYTRGTWNPETHKYEGDKVEDANEDKHYVKVTNSAESTIKVNVEFNYTCEDRDFEALQPTIALDGDAAKAVYTVRKNNLGVKNEAASTKAVLGFNGTLWNDQNIPGNVPLNTAIPFGTLKVTITGGDPK